jgi:hypothetical protein
MIDIKISIILVVGLVLVYILKRLFYPAAKSLPADNSPGFHFPSPISLGISALLFIAFIVFFMFIPIYFSHVFTDCRFLMKLQSESPLTLLLILISSITLAWLAARFHADFWIYNGFGTRMYVSDHDPLTARIGTKWLVMLLVPVLPVRSYKVIADRKLTWDHTDYVTEPLDSNQWDQVSETARDRWWIYGLVILGVGAVSAFSVIPCL